MGNQQSFRAAPTELGGMGDAFCYRHIAPNGACNAPPRRPSFSTELDGFYGSISSVLAGSALKCSIAGENDRRNSSN